MMSKRNKPGAPKATRPRSRDPARPGRLIWPGAVVAVGIAAALLVWLWPRGPWPVASNHAGSLNALGPASASSSNATASTNATLPSSEVAQAIMVTVELDFVGKIPTIKEALGDIERRHEPEDRRGRTFAILDAYGEPTPAGKLHLSMHLSMEKPGMGSLISRRTGEVLWKSRIVPATNPPPAEKSLTVLMDDGLGKSLMLDGSKGATHVLDVPLNGSTALVRHLWPDGQEREFTFIYSICGCPVKAKVRRTDETTARTSELPVMFPDDPAVMTVISHLMGWPDEG